MDRRKRWNRVREHHQKHSDGDVCWQRKEKKKSHRKNHRHKKRNYRGNRRIKKTETEGIQIRKITLEKENWKIITVYNRKEIMKTVDKIKDIISEEKEENLAIGRDFKIGKEITITWGDNRDEINKKSKDIAESHF